jgi:hypothetical protein
MKQQPLVYATFQAYLRRTPAQLVHALRDARTHGYALGVKLVRGAYHTHETAAHPGSGAPPQKGQTLSISPEALPPVWLDKADTDAAYDACAGLLLDAVAADVKSGLGALFGTHNWASCEKILEGLVQRGLAVATPEGRLHMAERVGERVTFGQLYGTYFSPPFSCRLEAPRAYGWDRDVRRPNAIPREIHGIRRAHGREVRTLPSPFPLTRTHLQLPLPDMSPTVRFLRCVFFCPPHRVFRESNALTLDDAISKSACDREQECPERGRGPGRAEACVGSYLAAHLWVARRRL